ncbi:MAG: Holliday junction branch migration protein RuvA [Ruminococcus sp.]|nr:Holliday junction branch migration protein RuvA [Ruminococcus sp.]
MFYSVRGKLIHTEVNIAVVECAGVGYKCQTTMNTLKKLKPDSEVTLYTYLNVREDAMELFGFATTEELGIFKTLIGVSGVGPKVGLAILSVLTPQQVALAIASNDVKSITLAQGVGNKLAQRIILELKDKLKNIASKSNSGAVSAASEVVSGNIPKAIEALTVLGYTPAEVTPYLAGMDSSLPVEKLIGETLRMLGRN